MSVNESAAGLAGVTERRPTVDEVLATGRLQLRFVLARFLPEASFKELTALVGGWGYEYDRRRASFVCWKMILSRWAELDPEGALAVERKVNSWGLRHWTFEAWAALDPHAALASARKAPMVGWAVARVIPELAKKDWAATLALIDEFPHEERVLSKIFELWARRDAAAALERVDQLTADVRQMAQRVVFRELAKENPAATLAKIRETKNLSLAARVQDEAAILEEVISEDPEAATPLVLSMPNGQTRYRTLCALARERAAQDPEATLVWGKQLPDGYEKQAVMAAATSKMGLSLNALADLLDEVGWQYAGANPNDTTEVKRMNGSSGSSGVTGSLAPVLEQAWEEALADDDLPGMLRVASRLPERRSGIVELLGERVEENAAAVKSMIEDSADTRFAADVLYRAIPEITNRETLYEFEPLIRGVNPGPLRTNVIRNMAMAMGKLDPEKLLSWTESLTASVEKEAAVVFGIRGLAENHLDRAFAAYEQLTDQRLRELSLPKIVNEQVKQDPAAAALWLSEQAESVPGVDADVYASVTSAWYTQDSLAVSKWIAQLPPGEGRGRAVDRMVSALTQGSRPDFPAAVAWAQTMDTAPEAAVRRVYAAWLQRDRAGALEALEGSALPESMKTGLRSNQR